MREWVKLTFMCALVEKKKWFKMWEFFYCEMQLDALIVIIVIAIEII